MKIVTFNLRCAWRGDDINAFPNRGGMILEKLAEEKPDIVCFQEGTERNIAFLRRALPEYDIVFNQRDADYSGEGLATALRRERVTLCRLNFFWLSETPEVPGSRFPEQSNCPRICQSLLVRTAEGKLLRVYNNHLDHASDSARILGIHCLLEHIEQDNKTNDFPFFILGDFNALPDSETIRYCNTCQSVPITDLTAGCGGTYHDFGREEPSKIDYIYADRQMAGRPYTAAVWEDQMNGVYLSDHYPVAVEIDL